VADHRGSQESHRPAWQQLRLRGTRHRSLLPEPTLKHEATGAAPMNMAAARMNTTPPSNSGPPDATKAPLGGIAPAGALVKVSINDVAFDPTLLTVKAGTTLVWTNNEMVAHTVTFTDVANSPILNRGDTFSRTFTAPGTYSYICSIHPFMHGTVVVTP
jgi:amicyanin